LTYARKSIRAVSIVKLLEFSVKFSYFVYSYVCLAVVLLPKLLMLVCFIALLNGDASACELVFVKTEH